MADSILQVEDIHLAFGGVKALRGVSFEVRRGEILSVIGPNGAGKTVCLNCINGLYRPQQGRIRFEGRDMGGPSNCYRSLAFTTMNQIFAQAQLGLIDYGVLGATQIDLYGNINSTMLGSDYRKPKKRFPGSGGANEVASFCWKTIVIMMHEKRRFVPRVDFITSPGYLDGTPGARERAGLPAGTGPWRVVTSKALFGFDEDSKKMTLLGVLEGLTLEQVLAEIGRASCRERV